MDNLDTTIASLGIRQPSISSSGKIRPRVLIAKFGDGYEQRSQDGPNNGMMDWTVVWNNLTGAQLLGLSNFLKTQGGWQRFLWTPPVPFNGSTLAWICEEWSWVFSGGQITGLSAPFMQRPAI